MQCGLLLQVLRHLQNPLWARPLVLGPANGPKKFVKFSHADRIHRAALVPHPLRCILGFVAVHKVTLELMSCGVYE